MCVVVCVCVCVCVLYGCCMGVVVVCVVLSQVFGYDNNLSAVVDQDPIQIRVLHIPCWFNSYS